LGWERRDIGENKGERKETEGELKLRIEVEWNVFIKEVVEKIWSENFGGDEKSGRSEILRFVNDQISAKSI
jgi:hypothetical protein